MENLSKRQTQAYETKKRIYLTTVELAEKYGFQKLKIQDVCKAAGGSCTIGASETEPTI